MFPDYSDNLNLAKDSLLNYNNTNANANTNTNANTDANANANANTNTNDYWGIYSILDIGMGCNLYLRFDYNSKSLLGYFMHSDSYGQYGEETNDCGKVTNFVENYKSIGMNI